MAYKTEMVTFFRQMFFVRFVLHIHLKVFKNTLKKLLQILKAIEDKDIDLKEFLIQLQRLGIYILVFQLVWSVLLSYQKLINHCFKYLGKNHGQFYENVHLYKRSIFYE